MLFFWFPLATQLDSRYVPRTILADLESGVFDSIREKEFGRLFEPDSFIAGSSGAGKNWAKGYFSEGLELSSRILERIRYKSEFFYFLAEFSYRERRKIQAIVLSKTQKKGI